MKLLAAVLAAFLLVTPAAASSVSDVCGPGMTLSDFVETELMIFEKDGTKIDPVYMNNPQLDTFIAAIKERMVAQGVPSDVFDSSTEKWEHLVWAKIKRQDGKEAIGIAVADKNNCLLEASVWEVDVFFGYMKKAFGVDA